MNNWYSIFYWLTVSDGVKSFFDNSSNIFSWFAVLTFIIYIILSVCESVQISAHGEDDIDVKSLNTAKNAFKNGFISFIIIAMITWIGYIFVPSKKDALIIIAGGTVGNFVTRDSSSKQIPAQVMLLLKTKIQEEIKQTSLKDIVSNEKDTLSNMTKEELIKKIKEQK